MNYPQDPVKNIEWRFALRRRAARDRGLRRELMAVCREDVLFFFNFALWLYEPRPFPKVIPFVTWPHQDWVIEQTDKVIGYDDFRWKKSRGEGATYGYLGLGLRKWLFESLFTAGLSSRNEMVVDSGQPGCLFAKLDWMVDALPCWMRPEGLDVKELRRQKYRKKLTLRNPSNEACWTGYSTTAAIASGDRQTVIFLDEFAKFGPKDDWLALASTSAVTDSRGIVSTFWGQAGAFYELIHTYSTSPLMTLFWADNPSRNDLLYRWDGSGTTYPVNGKDLARLRAYEQEYADELHGLRKAGFFDIGALHSVWYDKQCLRPGATPANIAEEYNCDPSASVPKIFSLDLLREMNAKHVMPPTVTGELIFDEHTCLPKKFQPHQDGHLKLWVEVGSDGRPPLGKYALGDDLATGIGGDFSSNTTMFGVDAISGQQVCEYINNKIRGDKAARYSVALARWFWNAQLNWETPGPGGAAFTKEMVDHDLYEYCYHVMQDNGKRREGPGTPRVNNAELHAWMDQLSTAMALGNFIPRSEQFIEECKQFEYKAGQVVHAGEQHTQNEANQGLAHGDVVIGAVMCWLAQKDVFSAEAISQATRQKQEISAEHALPGTYAGHLREQQQLDEEKGSWLNFR